jgi:isoquinoline 1-oxidoreductase alpha subunit
MSKVKELLINGVKYSVDVDGGASLLSVLRADLDLVGSKYGCGEGQCGACTVLLGGSPRRSCITPVGDAAQGPFFGPAALPSRRALGGAENTQELCQRAEGKVPPPFEKPPTIKVGGLESEPCNARS